MSSLHRRSPRHSRRARTRAARTYVVIPGSSEALRHSGPGGGRRDRRRSSVPGVRHRARRRRPAGSHRYGNTASPSRSRRVTASRYGSKNASTPDSGRVGQLKSIGRRDASALAAESSFQFRRAGIADHQAPELRAATHGGRVRFGVVPVEDLLARLGVPDAAVGDTSRSRGLLGGRLTNARHRARGSQTDHLATSQISICRRSRTSHDEVVQRHVDRPTRGKRLTARSKVPHQALTGVGGPGTAPKRGERTRAA